MASEASKDFVADVGSWKQIPIDSSLNELEKELRKEIKEMTQEQGDTESKRLPSRKLIHAALIAVDDQNNSEAEKRFLYYQIIESRRSQDDECVHGDTHPVPLFWELKQFTKAIAKAKFYNRTAKGNQLAELAVDDLLSSMLGKDPSVLGKTYLELQLLRENYVRNELIQQYRDEIYSRIDRIRNYTECSSWEIAARAMELVIPTLDALYIELQQNVTANDATITSSSNASLENQNMPIGENVNYVQLLHTLYEHLVENRPSIKGRSNDGAYLGKMQFSLKEHPAIIKALKKHFEIKWKCLRETDKKEFEKVYEQYLSLSINAETMKDIQTFLSTQANLAAHLKSTERWENIEPLVRKELCNYTVDMFNDIKRGDIVPYRYTEYQSQATSSKFVAALTKNAHDQIRATIHQPYKLLLAKSFIRRFNLDCAQDLPLFVFDISREIENLIESAKRELKILQESHTKLPLITDTQKEKVSEFICQYNDNVVPLFNTETVSEEKFSAWSEKIEKSASLMDRFVALSDFLEVNCKLVVKQEIEEAIKEIQGIYQAMIPFPKDTSIQ